MPVSLQRARTDFRGEHELRFLGGPDWQLSEAITVTFKCDNWDLGYGQLQISAMINAHNLTQDITHAPIDYEARKSQCGAVRMHRVRVSCAR